MLKKQICVTRPQCVRELDDESWWMTILLYVHSFIHSSYWKILKELMDDLTAAFWDVMFFVGRRGVRFVAKRQPTSSHLSACIKLGCQWMVFRELWYWRLFIKMWRETRQFVTFGQNGLRFAWRPNFDVLLTVYLSITLVNDRLDAQSFYFIIRLLQSSTCLEQRRAHHQEVKLY